jgi:hypothetical protein
MPFHTITIDFILGLLMSKQGKFDALATVTCKFSKRIALIPGCTTWKAEQWAEALVQRLTDLDWGLPKIIISDRDPKFVSEL